MSLVINPSNRLMPKTARGMLRSSSPPVANNNADTVMIAAADMNRSNRMRPDAPDMAGVLMPVSRFSVSFSRGVTDRLETIRGIARPLPMDS